MISKKSAINEMLDDLIIQKFEFEAKLILAETSHKKLLQLVSSESDIKKKHNLYIGIDQTLIMTSMMKRRINVLENNIAYYSSLK